jgi:hypothetical protein
LNSFFIFGCECGSQFGVARSRRQMIQRTTENKYCFHMQVSPRAMGIRGIARLRDRARRGAFDFELFEQWIGSGRDLRNSSPRKAADAPESTSQIRDRVAEWATTAGWRHGHRGFRPASRRRLEQEMPRS